MRHGYRPRLTPTPERWTYTDDDGWYDGNRFDDDDRERRDEFEDALDDCGRLPQHLGGGCLKVGSEYCDFDCPFRDGL